MENLIETCELFCLQYKDCTKCPLNGGICIDAEGSIALDPTFTVNDLVKWAHYIKVFADNLESEVSNE